jgi:hypothetical protein
MGFLCSEGELFKGTARLVSGFCDVAGESCLVVQRDWLMLLLTLNVADRELFIGTV